MHVRVQKSERGLPKRWYACAAVFAPGRPLNWLGTCPFPLRISLKQGANIMMDKDKAAHNLLRLVDACTQCRQIFHGTGETLNNLLYKNVVEEIQQKLEQFGIELRNEIRRLGEADLDHVRFESLQESACNRSLRRMLDYYEQAFNCHITPHTRAMLNRQYSDLQQIYHDMDLLPEMAGNDGFAGMTAKCTIT